MSLMFGTLSFLGYFCLLLRLIFSSLINVFESTAAFDCVFIVITVVRYCDGANS